MWTQTTALNAADTASGWISTRENVNPFKLTVAAQLTTGSTNTYTVQYTLARDLTDVTLSYAAKPVDLVWDIPSLTNQLTSAIAVIDFPVTGVRVKTSNGYTTGPVSIIVMQTGTK